MRGCVCVCVCVRACVRTSYSVGWQAADQLAAAADRLSPVIVAAGDQLSEASAALAGKVPPASVAASGVWGGVGWVQDACRRCVGSFLIDQNESG